MDGSRLIFSPHQARAIDAVARWLKHDARDQQIFRLFGYAGTGKTAIARYLAESLDGKVSYAAFTGKAALVMQKNGCSGASTIHSLIYSPRRTASGAMTFVLNPNSIVTEAALIVVDECSMVDEKLARDLMSFGKPILVLGDPAQLPPVSGAGFFTEASPDAMLSEIHRQAADSPIIRLATAVRQGRGLAFGTDGSSRVLRGDALTNEDVLSADQILVGTNESRSVFNAAVRDLRGLAGSMPLAGDRLVCLRNDSDLGIFNGGTFKVEQIIGHDHLEDSIDLMIASEDVPGFEPVEVSVLNQCFRGGLQGLAWNIREHWQEFDYGYALTVHKAQGSQWPSVLIMDESETFGSNRERWLYTAITRAAESVAIVRPGSAG